MSGLLQTLIALEHGFWTGGPEFYRENADSTCLVAFPGMIAELPVEEFAASVAGVSRWREVEIEVGGFKQPAADVAILSYEAKARRGADERYSAVVSSCYVERGGRWKLAFHQQTKTG